MQMKFERLTIRLTMRSVLWHTCALSVALLFVVPLLWVATNSLRPIGLPPARTLEWFPQPAAWSNYVEIFHIVPLGRQIANSIFVSTIGAAITLVTASCAGFAIAQAPLRLRRWLVALAVILMMTPSTAVWLPRYVLFASLGLIDSYAALFAPAVMGTRPLYVLMFFWAFRRIPHDLFESAHLDGASLWLTWQRIALPMALPTALAVTLLAFSHYWSDFVDPLLYLKSQSRYTLAVGRRMLQQMGITNWSLVLAAAGVVTPPVVLVYLFFQIFIRDDSTLSRLVKQPAVTNRRFKPVDRE